MLALLKILDLAWQEYPERISICCENGENCEPCHLERTYFGKGRNCARPASIPQAAATSSPRGLRILTLM